MPPTIVALPPRSGSMKFSDEDVTAVIELLQQCDPGQAVRLTDEPDESDNTARRRSELMKEQVETTRKDEGPLKDGYKIRGHVLTDGDPTTKEHTSKKTGKTYKVTSYPKNWAAVSLVPESDPDPVTLEALETPPAETPAKPARRRGGGGE